MKYLTFFVLFIVIILYSCANENIHKRMLNSEIYYGKWKSINCKYSEEFLKNTFLTSQFQFTLAPAGNFLLGKDEYEGDSYKIEKKLLTVYQDYSCWILFKCELFKIEYEIQKFENDTMVLVALDVNQLAPHIPCDSLVLYRSND